MTMFSVRAVCSLIRASALKSHVCRHKKLNLLVKCHVSTNAYHERNSSAVTTTMDFVYPEKLPSLPTYKVLDGQGRMLNQKHSLDIDKYTMVKMYQTMQQLQIMDEVLSAVQNQGKVSFYLSNTGEEALQVGSAAALHPQDPIYAQYREAGVLLWRGLTIHEMMNQCCGNADDKGKGRSMPVFYGSREHNVFTLSCPVGTQIPQAAGTAYALKRSGRNACVICYFGDGTASEGDFHVGLNFAATLECPVVFFCKNNGVAITTPTEEQYRGDGIAVRGLGYGVTALRVDGNDTFAVFNATKAAREIALTQNKPVLLEAVTFRAGDHSSAMKSPSNIEVDFDVRRSEPILRLRNYLYRENLWNRTQDKLWKAEAFEEIVASLKLADSKKKPSPAEMFTDVYDTMPLHIKRQCEEMKHHVHKYPQCYPTGKFEKMNSDKTRNVQTNVRRSPTT